VQFVLILPYNLGHQMLREFIDRESMFKLPMRAITILYGGYFELDWKSNAISDFYFHMEDEKILDLFLSVDNKHDILNTSASLLGLSMLNFDKKTKKFSDTMIERKDSGMDVPLWLHFESLSTGTKQLIGIMTLIMNSKKFGEKGLYIYHPEASLHAKTQSALGTLLAKLFLMALEEKEEDRVIHPLLGLSDKSVTPQIILRTHSEHLLNGLRVGILEHDKNHDGFVINCK